MLGREGPQRSLFGAAIVVESLLTPGSFYATLYHDADRLVADEDFADCYDTTTGRPSVPPARLAKLVLLQTYENLSDRQALERMTFDLRWKAILGLELGEGAIGQSTLVEYRARLQLHGKMRAVFDRFLTLALQTGLIRAETVQVIDSTAIWGRGAVEDTYNLIGAAVRKLLGVTARQRRMSPSALARELALELTDPADARSLKGRAAIDWDVPTERHAFLNRVVAEARRLLAATTAEAHANAEVGQAATLLRRVLMQDLESTPDGPPPPDAPASGTPRAAGESGDVLAAATSVQLRQAVARDRVVSVGDPEMRVGHKSARQWWAGYKVHAAVETGAEFITSIAVSEAGTYDGDLAVPMLEAQRAMGLTPAALVGDRAYSKAEVRVAVAARRSELIARVPPAGGPPGMFSKDVFTIDLATKRATCPAGVETRDYRERTRPLVVFPAAVCAACPLRTQCTTRTPDEMHRRKLGRTVTLHRLEAVLQTARLAVETPRVQTLLALRSMVERRLAHLMRMGLRQARYVGAAKVDFQSVATALVVNLRRLGVLFAIAPPRRERWAAAR